MATRRQIAMHTGGGGHDGAVGRGQVNVHTKVAGIDGNGLPVHVALTKDETHALHDQAVKDGRTQDAADIHARLESRHGGGGFNP